MNGGGSSTALALRRRPPRPRPRRLSRSPSLPPRRPTAISNASVPPSRAPMPVPRDAELHHAEVDRRTRRAAGRGHRTPAAGRLRRLRAPSSSATWPGSRRRFPPATPVRSAEGATNRGNPGPGTATRRTAAPPGRGWRARAHRRRTTACTPAPPPLPSSSASTWRGRARKPDHHRGGGGSPMRWRRMPARASRSCSGPPRGPPTAALVRA